jgi:all-trans-retinol dehydrogenase (NAD+)
MKLNGKTAVVTGGAMGIGLATSKRLLKEGIVVTIWDINEKALAAAEKELQKISNNFYLHVCDVTKKKAVYEMAKIAIAEMGRVDILINNAGYVKGGEFLDQPDEIWEKTIEINVNSMLYTIRAFLPKMYYYNDGHIINISSASGFIGVAGLSVYASTKWAVGGLTESMRFEAWNNKKYGVHWSSVHPSFLAEGLFEGAKLGFLGNLIVPLVKSHDVIAKAIVNDCLKKKKFSVRRPRSLRLTLILRGILPDYLFQKLMLLMGVHKSMVSWKGRE